MIRTFLMAIALMFPLMIVFILYAVLLEPEMKLVSSILILINFMMM